MPKYNFIIQKDYVTFMVDGKSYSINSSHPSFRAVRESLLKEDYEDACELLDIGKAMQKYSKGQVTISDGTVYFKNEPVHNVVCERILDFMSEQRDIDPLVNFLQRLLKNPSKRSVEQLYTFMEHKNIPVDKDGFIIAYKGVTNNYLDKWTGTIDNSPGTTNGLPRNKVEDNPDIPCGKGYHVGALAYATSWAGNNGRVVLCRIDPEDVVSVPKDASCQKMRTCQYTVIGDYDGPLPSTVYVDEPIDDFDDEDISQVW